MSQNLQLKRCRPHPFVKISFSLNNIVRQRIADNPSKCVEVVLFVNEIQFNNAIPFLMRYYLEMDQVTGNIVLCQWQVFTALFVVFWVISAFFDNFIITAILCVICGLIAGSNHVHGKRPVFTVE